MTIKDISRHLLQPSRHYSGLRMQQGRIILDSDFNEGEMLDDEDQRLALVDIIGPHGSADDGFKISNPNTLTYDFTIASGSYYVGGLRLQLDHGENFSAQGDWLQSTRAGVPLPALPDALRHDLIYLLAWEQEVTAVEDQEFLEQALGGPDTSVRVRRMHRVQVLADTGSDCHDAYAALQTALTAGVHAFDERSGELLSGTRLIVEASNTAVIDDLCQPPAISGYVGAENQAIRVQVIAADRFLWSYDNASPLYRIELPSQIDTDVFSLTFITPPRDQAHHPLVGQVLEILPWGADLANGETAADHPIAPGVGGGLYARVKTPYDPTTRTLTVDLVGTDLQPFVDWFGALAPEVPRYFYLRHWNPGDGGSGTVGLAFLPGTPVDLGGSGLKVTFSTTGLVGDFWIIGARPHTPATVVPWNLQSAATPHGPRRFYAPLGMLHWTLVDQVLAGTAESCRRTFRPLTEQGGCCTVTVGDGDQSFGDYRTIGEAIAALPPSGGKVCVFAGVYEERVVLTGRTDVVIEGCCERTILRTPPDSDTSAGLITLTGCQRITLRNFTIEATAQIGVMLMPDVAGQQGPITLDGLVITTQRDPAQVSDPPSSALWLTTAPALFPCPTVAADQITGLEIVDCTLTMVGHYSAMPNVLLQAATLSIVRDSKIYTPPAPGVETVSEAWGGLHLAGGCEHVQVLHNEIKDGMGHGITLGNVVYGTASPLNFADTFTLGTPSIIDPGMDCPGVGGHIGDFTAPPGGGPDVETFPGALLKHISIVDNFIHDMHTCGISAIAFWPEPVDLADFKMIQTHDLLVDHNRIVDNYQKPNETILSDPLLLDVLAFGGITLAAADDLRVFDNSIIDNGVDHLRPVCGIFVLHGENIDIERNLIRDNGKRVTGDGNSGVRAGIALQMAGRRIDYDGAGGLESVAVDNLYPAARVRGNTVLQPVGRSLQLYGLGPMVLEGNHLVSGGLTGTVPADAAHAVEVINLGQSHELIADGSMPSFFGFLPAPPIQGDPNLLDERLLDGRILYTNNQVRLKVDGSDAQNMFCAVRLLSHGDVLLQGNQPPAQHRVHRGHGGRRPPRQRAPRRPQAEPAHRGRRRRDAGGVRPRLRLLPLQARGSPAWRRGRGGALRGRLPQRHGARPARREGRGEAPRRAARGRLPGREFSTGRPPRGVEEHPRVLHHQRHQHHLARGAPGARTSTTDVEDEGDPDESVDQQTTQLHRHPRTRAQAQDPEPELERERGPTTARRRPDRDDRARRRRPREPPRRTSQAHPRPRVRDGGGRAHHGDPAPAEPQGRPPRALLAARRAPPDDQATGLEEAPRLGGGRDGDRRREPGRERHARVHDRERPPREPPQAVAGHQGGAARGAQDDPRLLPEG